MANPQCISYNLCDELVSEILLRLPTKSAVRLQVVCKNWYSLVSSPYFIHLRHHKHRDVNSSIVFQIRYYCDRTCNSGNCREYHSEFKTISNNSSLLCDDDIYEFSLDYLPCSPIDLRLKASFDDLILCYCITNPKELNYYVISLFTRQWIALPSPPAHEGRLIEMGFLCVPPPYSECKSVISSHHKFMVVRLFIPKHSIRCCTFEVQIFSSEDGKWRTLVVSSPLPFRGYTTHTYPLVAYRGMLHWLNEDCIAVYDPLNNPETFSRIIHFPIRRPRLCRDYFGFKLCVCQGHIRVVESSAGLMDVWELEDYDSGVWNLVHKVYYNNLIYDNSLPSTGKSLLNFLSVVNLHPENGDVVYMLTDKGIALVNMKTRIVERYYPLKKNAKIHIAAAFHLADISWPTPVSSLLH